MKLYAYMSTDKITLELCQEVFLSHLFDRKKYVDFNINKQGFYVGFFIKACFQNFKWHSKIICIIYLPNSK